MIKSMESIKFSKHALLRMKQRGITENQVNKVIRKPDSIIEKGDRKIYQSLIESSQGKSYLLRVFVNTNKSPNLIITVYKTSKIDKYL